VQVLFNGSVNGLLLAVLALAFVTVYLPTRVFFLALAGIYSIVPFVARAALLGGMHATSAVFLALLCGTGLALLFELLNHGPLQAKRAGEGAHLVSSLGLYIVLTQITTLIWGRSPQTLRQGSDTVFHLGGVVATRAQLLALAGSIAILMAYLVLQRQSGLGLRLRAMASNPDLLELHGHDTRKLSRWAFALSGLMASAASLLGAFDAGFDAYRGLGALLLAVVAVIVGGRYSFLGPVLGAIGLGILRAASVWFFSAQWQEVITFAVLVICLVFRPEGIVRGVHRLEGTG
jgi:branched-chain amino acid transport system permease protein